jgi:pSer/pThr/pTyr-binding forkhead associated (FHA) protein
MRQMILVWEQDDHQHTHQLQSHKPVLIGRHKACTIRLPYSTVSRRHALVFLQQSRVMLRNLSRMNTIRSEDGQRVASEETVTLSNGQRFQVGPVTFRLLALPGEDTVVKIRCANCRRVVAYDPQGLCPWCGTALAAGQTVGE